MMCEKTVAQDHRAGASLAGLAAASDWSVVDFVEHSGAFSAGSSVLAPGDSGRVAAVGPRPSRQPLAAGQTPPRPRVVPPPPHATTQGKSRCENKPQALKMATEFTEITEDSEREEREQAVFLCFLCLPLSSLWPLWLPFSRQIHPYLLANGYWLMAAVSTVRSVRRPRA